MVLGVRDPCLTIALKISPAMSIVVVVGLGGGEEVEEGVEDSLSKLAEPPPEATLAAAVVVITLCGVDAVAVIVLSLFTVADVTTTSTGFAGALEAGDAFPGTAVARCFLSSHSASFFATFIAPGVSTGGGSMITLPSFDAASVDGSCCSDFMLVPAAAAAPPSVLTSRKLQNAIFSELAMMVAAVPYVFIGGFAFSASAVSISHFTLLPSSGGSCFTLIGAPLTSAALDEAAVAAVPRTTRGTSFEEESSCWWWSRSREELVVVVMC